ncbi:DUF2637 domain-containing protein [Streptomyces anandii]|uniref:DUF2637 domain-containing protein n=1 Tax=Streptomyces anandii TaxID=285454 RepID=UPI00379DE84D
MPGGVRKTPVELSRAHRVLIGVVVSGAVVIAGIGFAGSYAAVRELAIKKGFGAFSYVFPIGIDAGICVLLALDLLLTWIRIPFPLLRHTAWLLTAATIAFNGAAAWPDPLGVGMHAVIPVLFIVAVEAARHAIGRIADITADKHMEGVRLTRWFLSPVPTFLLWRRMKLWELRSYDQVIQLEQQRLVYQAGLRSRFGRAWRRKAPVESLMPLRLARYGVPLAETAPVGLASAGIDELPIQFSAERPLLPAQRRSPALEAAVHQKRETAKADGAQARLGESGRSGAVIEAGALLDEPAEPLPRLLERHHTPSSESRTESRAPHTPDDLEYLVSTFPKREFDEPKPPTDEEATEPAAQTPSGEFLPNGGESERESTPVEELPGEAEAAREPAVLTTVDRYYLAWTEYRTEYGEEPKAEKFSAYLASRKGMTGRGGRPVSPSTLRRYLLPFRVYSFWAKLRMHSDSPSLQAIAQECAAHGITAQHNKPLTTDYIAEQADDFERRWQALTRLHAHPRQ